MDFEEQHNRGSIDDPGKKLKHMINASLNSSYLEDSFIQDLSTSFLGHKTKQFDNGAYLSAVPFPCCILPHFIQPNAFVYRLEQELKILRYKEKRSDLFQFKQSKDLRHSSEANISCFRNLLYEDCLAWMKKITNIPLVAKVDFSCTYYKYTDHLLCHDDELEDRRIAFIYYLVPEWEKDDGGLLELYNSVDGQPSEITNSIIPKWNNFVFFEVSPISFHRVSEMLSCKSRLSVSGWFHGPPRTTSPPIKETLLFSLPNKLSVDIKDWLNPNYLDPTTQLEIRENFERSSEIQLTLFLQEKKYLEVGAALKKDSNIKWISQGPPNRRSFEEASEGLPLIVTQLQNLLTSEVFFVILSNITGLSLHPLSEENSTLMGKYNFQIRKWNPGNYSLLYDESFKHKSYLDAVLTFNCLEWEPNYGGSVNYAAEMMKDHLLCIERKSNTLSLVYINEGTSRFVDYINEEAREDLVEPFFHDISIMYVEAE